MLAIWVAVLYFLPKKGLIIYSVCGWGRECRVEGRGDRKGDMLIKKNVTPIIKYKPIPSINLLFAL